MTLKELPTGKSAIVQTVGGEGPNRQHFLDMGLIPGVIVTLVKYAPMGDPMELMLHGYSLTLRLADAELIEITPYEGKSDHATTCSKQDNTPYIDSLHEHNSHPSFRASEQSPSPRRATSRKDKASPRSSLYTPT